MLGNRGGFRLAPAGSAPTGCEFADRRAVTSFSRSSACRCRVEPCGKRSGCQALTRPCRLFSPLQEGLHTGAREVGSPSGCLFCVAWHNRPGKVPCASLRVASCEFPLDLFMVFGWFRRVMSNCPQNRAAQMDARLSDFHPSGAGQMVTWFCGARLRSCPPRNTRRRIKKANINSQPATRNPHSSGLTQQPGHEATGDDGWRSPSDPLLTGWCGCALSVELSM